MATSEDEQPRLTKWRVGTHYGIHVYEGDAPVGTFHVALDARRAVRCVNDDIDRTESYRAVVRRIESYMSAVAKGYIGQEEQRELNDKLLGAIEILQELGG